MEEIEIYNLQSTVVEMILKELSAIGFVEYIFDKEIFPEERLVQRIQVWCFARTRNRVPLG